MHNRFASGSALRCAALRCSALHCTALHCTALHCTALHCTALHCTARCQTSRACALPSAARWIGQAVVHCINSSSGPTAVVTVRCRWCSRGPSVLSTGAKALAKHCHRDSAVRLSRVPPRGIYAPPRYSHSICVPLFMNHHSGPITVQFGRSVVGAHGIVSLCCRAYLRVSPLGAAEPPCRRCRAEPSRAERATERLAGVLGGGGLRDREAKEQLGGHEGTCARMQLVRNLSEATSRSPLALLVYSSS